MTTDTRIEALRQKTVANGATEPEAQSAAAKVAELLASAASPGTLSADDPLPPNLSPAEEAEVIRHMNSLGYRLIPEGESRTGGRLRARYIETDEQANGIKTYLQDATIMRRLGSGEAADLWRKITTGKRIQMPDKHPSGHRSSEMAHTSVSALGSGQHTPGRRR